MDLNRMVGIRPKKKKPELSNSIANLNSTIKKKEEEIAILNDRLNPLLQQMKDMRDGPAKRSVRKRSLKVLAQRNDVEKNRDEVQDHVRRLERLEMTQENLKNTVVMVDTIKTVNKDLKKQYGKINIDKIERLQDETEDLMDAGRDIQETISRSYGVSEDVDEDDLDAELEALVEEQEFDNLGMETEGALPSFMRDEMPPQYLDEAPEQSKVKEAVG